MTNIKINGSFGTYFIKSKDIEVVYLAQREGESEIFTKSGKSIFVNNEGAKQIIEILAGEEE